VSSRTQSALVGAFVVGAIVIAVAGGLFFAGIGLGTERSKVVMVFEGSLHGLNVGAPVALRGVTIGQVTDIDVLLNPAEGDLTMIVEAEIEAANVQMLQRVDENIAHELVARGLRAQLNTQSLLTGLLYIQLDFYPDSTPRLANLDRGIPEIPTIPTELEQLRRSLAEIDLVALSDSVDRIATGVAALVNNEDMQALPAAMRSTVEAVQSASDELTATLGANSERVAALLDEGGATLRTVNERLPGVMGSLESSLQRFEGAIASAEASLASLEAAAAPDSAPRQQLQAALQELSLAARALRFLAYSLEEYPESLLRGRAPEGDGE
jgi:paraquat-inducible protein B